MKKVLLVTVALLITLPFSLADKVNQTKRSKPLNDEMDKLSKLDITSIELDIFFSHKTKIKIKPSLYKQFKSAIINSKPYSEEDPESYISIKAYGQLIFSSEKNNFVVDICGDMFFWGSNRKTKYAFVSNKLLELIIAELNEMEDMKKLVDILKSRIKNNNE